MPRKPKPEPDDPAQFKRFIDMAREVGAGEHPEHFDRVLKKVADAKREITSNPRSKSGSAKKRAKL